MDITESGVVMEAPVAAEAPALRKLGLLPRLLGRLLFRHARVDAGAVDYLRQLACDNTLVYVMRFRSVIELFLIAHVLVREGLPLPQMISGIPTLLLRPVREVLRILLHRLRTGQSLRRSFDPVAEAARCRRLVAAGKPALIFMRTGAPGIRLFRGAADALSRVRTGNEYLRELVIQEWGGALAPGNGGRGVALVPLAVVRGRGFHRKASRFATMLYSVREAPSELRRLVSLAWNARELSIVIGKHIDVRASIDRYRNEGAERLTRRLSSALRLFLQREERLIAGPTLLPKRTVRELVLRGGDYENVVAELAATEGKPETDIRRRAAKYFEEIAADYHGTYFALVAFVFNRIWPRIFGGFEQIGLERVVEHARRHPIVLVPCHRSHFDYLILSYLFHQQYLSPPHIAAGINLSFWPLGPLFRGAGAYFIRRSFAGDELYKVVFRNYLTFLIREGYTQEFFIEGGRSRTGKMLSPKLGMLSALVSAYLSGARRDLYFVPVSIHYGRVVEERAYERELQGAEKEKESLGGLLKARSLLRQYYGSVYVSFAEPISLRAVLGDQRERLQLAGTTAGAIADSVEQEKRELVSALALRILREVNNVTVAGATSVAATVLLGSEQGALRYDDFVARCTALGRDLEARQILLTASLRSALASGDFRNSCEFLGAAGLVSRIGGADDIVQVPPSKRLILDFYKNTALHFFLVPSLLVRAIGAGRSEDELEPEVRQWLDLFRLEFPAVPENLSEEIGATLLRLRQAGAVSANGQLQLRREHALVQALAPVLDNFREAYAVVERSLAELPAEGMRERQWRERVQQRYQAALLLGEARKPEGNSAATIDNALKINAARGLVVVSEVAGRGKRSRERVLQSPAPPP